MMSDRVHACLDGEIPREALTPGELDQVRALEAAMGAVARSLRAAPAPDLSARVMAALPAAAATRPAAPAPLAWERAMRWLWSPRILTLRLRPAYGVAGLALAALVGVLLPGVRPAADGAPMVAEAPRVPRAARLYVQFRLEAPEASQVKLAGSFTGWQPKHELREVAPGVWTALIALEPGVHDYTFVVDGEQWVADPYAPQVDDSFGGTNSRLFLPVPSQQT